MRQQQAATANVLKVISRSAFDLQAVLDTLVESAHQVCGANLCLLYLKGEEVFECKAIAGPGVEEASLYFKGRPIRAGRATAAERVIMTSKVQSITDFFADPDFDPKAKEIIRDAGNSGSGLGVLRSTLAVPMMRDEAVIGVMVIARSQTGAFPQHQINLLQSFADQAVIAIENARLFAEVQAKTRDLSEALTYQTGSSNILGVIASSPTDVEPVLKAIAESACELCNAHDAVLRLRDGENLCVSAHHGPIPTSRQRWPINPNWTAGRSVLDRKPIHVSDMLSPEGDGFPEGRKPGSTRGLRTILSVPLLREGEPIGAITLRRTEVHPFSDKQITLLQTFADQAVIAIGNVRLFEEVQAKTRDLEESLQQQIATAEVLQVINSSPGELTPVFDAMLERAMRLCRAAFGGLWVFEGDCYIATALRGVPPDYANYLSRTTVVPGPHTAPYRFREGERSAIQNVDLAAEEPYLTGDPQRRALVDLGGARTALQVPLVRDEVVVGVITVYRQEVRPFSDKQVELLQNFASQAVIAIENARLFNETKEALERQTATAEILKVIASSPNNVQPVFQAIAERSKRLVDALSTTVFTLGGDMMHLEAFTPTNPEADAALQAMFPAVLFSFSWGEAVRKGEIYRVVDTESELDNLRELAQLRGFRSMLLVPLVRDRMTIGLISVTRVDPGPFADHHVQLLQTFADQAVIAIENVRMFDEVQARTREVQDSLKQQTAVGDVLKIISRSTFDLQPVLDTLVQTAADLCEADMAFILRREENRYRAGAAVGFSREYIQFLQSNPIAVNRGTITGRTVLARSAVQVADVAADPEYTMTESTQLAGQRTALGVPLLRENEPIGVIVLARQRVEAFTANQVEVVTTFADQAVIAIENVRLFEELKRRTEDLAEALDKQTATLEELRTAQDRLVQTEKLASLGQLTAGIAHEIKNPLNFVNNFSALSAELTDELNDMLQSAALADDIRHEVDELTRLLKGNLEKIVQHGKRADSIVKNMLLHSREGSGERRFTDVNDIIEDSLNLAYHGARAERPGFDITLQRDLDPTAGEVELYPQEITRALLNLISNGFYAATKRAADADNGFEPVLKAVTKNLADRVEIRIRDNGTGIPADMIEKIFNPFFTTKPAGEGTGLGLSMSHDIIVKQHGGTIEVETETGRFTEFRIVLPRSALAHRAAGGRSK